MSPHSMTLEENDVCYQLRSEAYARHYKNIPKGKFVDEFDSLEHYCRVHNFILENKNQKVVATIRGVIAWQEKMYPEVVSEIQQLMKLKDLSLFLWSYLLQVRLHITGVLEIGKLAITKKQGRSKDMIRSLTKQVIRFAKNRNVNLGAFILPRFIARVMKNCHISIQ